MLVYGSTVPSNVSNLGEWQTQTANSHSTPTMTTTPARDPAPINTPLSTRLRRPLQSPYSSSPLAHEPSTSTAESHDDARDLSSSSYPTSSMSMMSPSSYLLHGPRHGLSERHIREIMTVFQVFDPDLSGFLDVASFEIMVRSLGFRMTRTEIVSLVEWIWEERRPAIDPADNNSNGGSGGDDQKLVDLSAAIQILSQRGYARRNAEDEIQMYFRIFDGGNKGYITLEDLQRVQQEAMREEESLRNEIQMDGSGSGVGRFDVGAVGDATLQAMIQEFDQNRDGVIDLNEFKALLEPLISSSS